MERAERDRRKGYLHTVPPALRTKFAKYVFDVTRRNPWISTLDEFLLCLASYHDYPERPLDRAYCQALIQEMRVIIEAEPVGAFRYVEYALWRNRLTYAQRKVLDAEDRYGFVSRSRRPASDSQRALLQRVGYTGSLDLTTQEAHLVLRGILDQGDDPTIPLRPILQ